MFSLGKLLSGMFFMPAMVGLLGQSASWGLPAS